MICQVYIGENISEITRNKLKVILSKNLTKRVTLNGTEFKVQDILAKYTEGKDNITKTMQNFDNTKKRLFSESASSSSSSSRSKKNFRSSSSSPKLLEDKLYQTSLQKIYKDLEVEKFDDFMADLRMRTHAFEGNSKLIRNQLSSDKNNSAQLNPANDSQRWMTKLENDSSLVQLASAFTAKIHNYLVSEEVVPQETVAISSFNVVNMCDIIGKGRNLQIAQPFHNDVKHKDEIDKGIFQGCSVIVNINKEDDYLLVQNTSPVSQGELHQLLYGNSVTVLSSDLSHAGASNCINKESVIKLFFYIKLCADRKSDSPIDHQDIYLTDTKPKLRIRHDSGILLNHAFEVLPFSCDKCGSALPNMSTAKFANYIYRPFCGKDCFDKHFENKINIKVVPQQQQSHHQQIVQASSAIPAGLVIVKNISKFLQLGTELSRHIFDVTSSSYGSNHLQPGLFYWEDNSKIVYDNRSAMSWFHFLKRSSNPAEYNCEVKVEVTRIFNKGDDEEKTICEGSLGSTRDIGKGTELVLKNDESVYYLSDPSPKYHYEWDQF